MAAAPISACVQLAEELRALGLPLLQPLPAKNNGAGGGSKTRAPLGATDLSELRWETRQGVLLALLAEIPGSPAGPALQQLVAQRRAACRAEKELERRGRPEELGLLPEYVRREEDAFRRRLMAAVGEELQRQGAPKPLLAATADPARMLGDRGLCLRVIEFFVARHRSRARTLAGLQQRILSPPAPPASPSPAAAAAAATAGTPVASSATTSSSSARKVPSSAARRSGMATPVQQRPPSPLVMEPSTSSSSSSALRSERRRSATKAPASVAELSSPLLRQGIRRLSLQGGGGGALWSQEQQEQDEQEAPAPVVVASAERAARRRSSVSGSKTPASKLVEGDGVVEEERERPRQSEEVVQVQSKPKVKPWAQGSSSGVCVKGKVEEQQQVGLAELLPPVRGPRKEKPAAAVRASAPPAAALEGHEGVEEDGDGDLRAENARLRAELGEAQALYEALMRGQRAAGDRVDARCLALMEQQGAMLAREGAGLRREVDGYRDLAEGATALLGGVEAFCQELLAHARGEESTNKNGRRRSSHSPVPPSSSAEFWAAALVEAKQLHGRWRSAKRASRVKHQHHLLLPHDARVFLRRPAERADVAAGGEAAVPVPLSGEWEDRARLRGGGGGEEEEEGGSGLSLDLEGVRGLSGRLRGLVAALDEALQEGDGASDGLCALRDQARALQLQMAQLGLAAAHAHAGSSPASAVKVTGERALLEAFDGLLVPRLRPQELRERVDGLRRLVLAERGALAKGMASALEEAVAWRRRRRGGRGGGYEDEEGMEEGSYVNDDDDDEEEEEEEEGEEGEHEAVKAPGVMPARKVGVAAVRQPSYPSTKKSITTSANGTRRAAVAASGGRPQWV